MQQTAVAMLVAMLESKKGIKIKSRKEITEEKGSNFYVF
jgi:hypothetical protein